MTKALKAVSPQSYGKADSMTLRTNPKFSMGTESRKPSYLNHDAIKFPGVGDYTVNKNSSFGSPKYSMGAARPD